MKSSIILSSILFILAFIFGWLYANQANKIKDEFNVELKFSWRSNREFSRSHLKALMNTNNIDLRKAIKAMLNHQGIMWFCFLLALLNILLSMFYDY